MFIARTKLSKALITDPAKIEWRTPADLKIKYGTNLRLGLVSEDYVVSEDSTQVAVGSDLGRLGEEDHYH